MWQKQLKQMKKQTIMISKVPIKQKIEPAQPEINFSQYCTQIQVEPLKHKAIADTHIHKTQKSSTVKNYYLQNNNSLDDFMMFDEQDCQLEFFRFGQRNLPKELRLGKYRFNEVLDLHHYTKAHSIDILSSLITNSPKGACLRIIHGSGLNSEYNQPVLRNAVRKYLAQHPQVLAYSYGTPQQGGHGVTIVKLTSN